MEPVDDIEVRRIRFLLWEAEIPRDNSIYYFPAYTKKGAIKRADKFLKEEK